jgi:hypothetical protein
MKINRQVIVFDAADLTAESTFWAAVLGGKVDPEDNWHMVYVGGQPYASSSVARCADTSENGTVLAPSSAATFSDGRPDTMTVSRPVATTAPPAPSSTAAPTAGEAVRSVTRSPDAAAISSRTLVSAMTRPRRSEAHQVGHLVNPPGRETLRAGQPQQVVAPGPAGLQRARVQQRSDVAQRAPQARVRPPADQRRARIRCIQPQDDPHRGGLAGAVGADEPRDLARISGKDIPSRASVVPSRLRSPLTAMVASFIWSSFSAG